MASLSSAHPGAIRQTCSTLQSLLYILLRLQGVEIESIRKMLARAQERLTRDTVTGTMRTAAHASGCARCGAGAGCLAIKYQFLFLRRGNSEPTRAALAVHESEISSRREFMIDTRQAHLFDQFVPDAVLQ